MRTFLSWVVALILPLTIVAVTTQAGTPLSTVEQTTLS